MKSELPVDRGWAWVICFASFMCFLLSGLGMQSLSVLFLELVIEFQTSYTTTSFSIMVLVLSLSLASIISVSVLVPRFDERKVTVVAGVVYSACFIGYSVAPNIGIFITFSAVQGLAIGSMFVPNISILGAYFSKRRSLAISIGNSGICVASIVGPPFIRALVGHYGMRGAFLILSAIELHMVAVGLLLRPVSSYSKLQAAGPDSVLLNQNVNETKTKSEDIKETDQSQAEQNLTVDMKNKKNLGGSDAEKQQLIFSTTETTQPSSPVSNAEDSNFSQIDFDMEFSPNKKRHFRRNDSTVSEILPREKPLYSRNVSTRSSTRGSIKRLVRQQSLQQNGDSKRLNGSVMSIASNMEVVAVAVDVAPSDVTPRADERKGKSWRDCCCIKIVRNIFDPALFKQWAFIVFLITSVPGATNQYLFQYIPTIAVIKGATNDQGATLLTITGSVDLVSRILVGLFADTQLIRATQIVSIAQICLGIVCHCNPLFTNFDTLIVMAVLMGVFVGTRLSLLPLMLIEIVGMGLLARCLSITAMIATISAACHGPLLSSIVQAKGSFQIVLHYVGTALIVSAIGILMTPLLVRLDKKQEEKKLHEKQKNNGPIYKPSSRL
ncbi:uncharacterized protein LOC131957769 [Physella acuta]|uniref:uncharacterized protein LOC131957769 n=1 Tax=Physella acuta TaxID=109671 RepID=UPI0027DE19CE|nr:uncharacterized protein LOC131957769 [Physella acuta]